MSRSLGTSVDYGDGVFETSKQNVMSSVAKLLKMGSLDNILGYRLVLACEQYGVGGLSGLAFGWIYALYPIDWNEWKEALFQILFIVPFYFYLYGFKKSSLNGRLRAGDIVNHG